MDRSPSFDIVETTETYILIRDVGPWDKHLSVTNGVEEVVKLLLPMLKGRRLFYYDSEGIKDEIVIKDGKFVAFLCVVNQ